MVTAMEMVTDMVVTVDTDTDTVVGAGRVTTKDGLMSRLIKLPTATTSGYVDSGTNTEQKWISKILNNLIY